MQDESVEGEDAAGSGSEVDEDLEEELVDSSIFCLAAHSGKLVKSVILSLQTRREYRLTLETSADSVYAVAWAGSSTRVVATGGGDDIGLLWKLVRSSLAPSKQDPFFGGSCCLSLTGCVPQGANRRWRVTWSCKGAAGACRHGESGYSQLSDVMCMLHGHNKDFAMGTGVRLGLQP